MKVLSYSKDEWKVLAADAHAICFHELRDPEMDRIDFALLAVDEEKPLAYMTVRELDAKSAYLQHGGSFDHTRGTANSYRSYLALLNALKEKNYTRAGTYIENTNTPMLKFAMKAGWLITGIRTFEGSILLEHQLQFKDI